LNILSEWKFVEQLYKTETAAASLKQFLKFNMQTYKFRLMSSHFIVTSSKKEITDNLLLKLTAVNFDHNTLKLFSHIEIFVNKVSHLDMSVSIKKVKTFLYIKILKRRQKNNDTDFNEFMIKILKIMLTLTAFTVNDENNEHSAKTDISTSLIYAEAVRDSIWEKM